MGFDSEYRVRSEYRARPNEELKVHLDHVAEMAGEFATVFGGKEFARTCGYLHDLGKYSNAFQDYMERVVNHEKVKRGEAIHSLQGGIYAFEHFKDIGIVDILVNVVASHHGGLLNMLESEGRTSAVRLKEKKTREGDSIHDLYEQALSVPEARALVANIGESTLVAELKVLMRRLTSIGMGCFGVQMFVRMVYSCLVDADRCDAAGLDGKATEPPWEDMGVAVERYLARFKTDTPLNVTRNNISRQCFEEGARRPGIYTLSVPTGGGKTLSSLRFAIRHAQQNHLKRVVYVIPFLSIIDQTVKELRAIFGNKVDEWVLEHHSNVVVCSEEDEGEDERKLLTERWDRPIVVTTMVRFMETVLSNRASDLRKLHNMTETVFVFDEIQSLPIRCIYLFNMTVNFLCQMCGSSAVLCTATQPALTEVEKRIALARNHALISLDAKEEALFKRVEFVNKTACPMTTAEIAAFGSGFLKEGKSVLIVLNTKKTALAVYSSCRVPDNCDKLFLSTDLCARHRKDNIERARTNLKSLSRRTTLCVSTQLVEAGVDLSFDVVIRANAGIDNIIQAGGRCNRNGEHFTRQPVYIVEVAGEDLSRLPGIATAKNAMRRARNDFPDAELTDACVLSRFYLYLFEVKKDEMGYPIPKTKNGETVYNVLDQNPLARSLYRSLNEGDVYRGCAAAFSTAAETFRMIDGEQIAAVVPYAPCREGILAKIAAFRRTFDPKDRVKILRQLQPYTVSLYATRESWLQSVAEKVCDVFYLVGEGCYNLETGLTDVGSDPMI